MSVDQYKKDVEALITAVESKYAFGCVNPYDPCDSTVIDEFLINIIDSLFVPGYTDITNNIRYGCFVTKVYRNSNKLSIALVATRIDTNEELINYEYTINCAPNLNKNTNPHYCFINGSSTHMEWKTDVKATLCGVSDLFRNTISNNTKKSLYCYLRKMNGAIIYHDIHERMIKSLTYSNVESIINTHECIAIVPEFPRDPDEINMFVMIVQFKGVDKYKHIHSFRETFTR